MRDISGQDMMTDPVKIGILGCGAIAPAYLDNLTARFNGIVAVAACSDVREEVAREMAERYKIPECPTPEALFQDEEIELIVNLTPAPMHFETSLQILRAGKHLFSEKPLCLDMADAKKLMDEAESRGLHIAGAPDTFLGAGFQIARKLIEEGKIGTPIAATGLVTLGMFSVERYHKVFQGALLDLSPYYITALVQLFGSVTSVTGVGDKRFPERTDKESGKTFELNWASTTAASLSFESGPVATLLSSGDLDGYFPKVEIFGTEGHISLSDANMYARTPLELCRQKEEDTIVPSAKDGFCEEGRGLGVAEMCHALRNGKTPRSNGSLMYHVLEVMLAVYEAIERKTHVSIDSSISPCDAFGIEDLEALIE